MTKNATMVDVSAEMKALRRMTVPQLQARYEEVWGEPVRSRHKRHLIARIIWRIQANAEGDLPARARKRAAELADDSLIRLRAPRPRSLAGDGATLEETFQPDSRLPMPGTLLVREYKGRRYEVRVLPKGFEYEGEIHRSLSAVAKLITGSHWNGYLFFGVSNTRKETGQ